MNRLVEMARKLRISVFAGVCWLGTVAGAWAQQMPGQDKPGEAPPYVVPYAAVILCIGLGVAIVLNSSKRRERAKPEVYGEPK
jgi:hypothetical protein